MSQNEDVLVRIESVEGTGCVVRGDDIDTDRIIPARFMKCITFDGLGEFMFYDVRKNGITVIFKFPKPRTITHGERAIMAAPLRRHLQKIQHL